MLHKENIDIPVPMGNEVLLKVCATTVNDYDWCVTSGKPLSYRLLFGLSRPRPKMRRPGMEVAGVIEGIGPGVTKFEIGDEVYGDTSDEAFGSYSEYMSVSEDALTIKPSGMSFEEAASIPHAAALAMQGLIDAGSIRQNDDVLINGGGGGVGAFGLQIAKEYGAVVTGVDTGPKLDLMLEHGFDRVVDYKQKDFARGAATYDLILDCRSTRSPFACLRALKPGGRYVTIGGDSGRILQVVFFKPLIALTSNKRVHMVNLKTNKDLGYINRLYGEGKIKCVIDGPYTFDEVPEAILRFGQARHHGKVVISMD